MLPLIRRYHGSEVTFNMIALATEGAPYYDSYTWNITTAEVRRDAGYPSLSTDTYVPTGETISPMIDPRLPSCGETCGPFFNGNVLSVYSPSAGGLFPVYNTPNTNLFQARFIQNGERILLGEALAGTDGTPQWSILERNGAVLVKLGPDIKMASVTGWQDGFLYVPPVINVADKPTLVVYTSRNNKVETTIAWTGKPGAQIVLLQTPSNMQSAGPFTPWKQLAPPSVMASQPAAPADTGALKVGGRAIVNTTQGDKLRVRSGPGTSFAVIMLLDKGTVVTLLEGPHSGDGLTWWRIRTPDGVEGWVIESIDDNGEHIQTLIPA